MTLKNAALLALIGTMLMTALFGMGVRFQPGQCPAGRGRASGALLVIYLCVWLLYPDGVLFRVPSSAAVVVISARTALTITATRRRLEQPQWFLEV
jgi:hypothetical protein